MSDRRIRIGLLWHSANSGNLGVGALTVANIALARRAAAAVGLAPRFVVIGSRDEGPHYVTGEDVEVFGLDARSLVSPAGFWSVLGPLDCVLDIGGGDSFAEIYGAKRFAWLWLTKVMALARGVPLLMSPQTIGPFEHQPYRALAAAVMARSEAVVARDPMSFAALKAIAPRARALEAVDVAFALPYEPSRTNPATVDVGVNVSGLLFNGGYSGRNEFGLDIDYAAVMRRFIAALVERPGMRVHLVCHVNAPHMPADDDGAAADRLAREFPSAIRAPDFASPSAAKSYISGLDLLVAGRMHACIAGYSSGVPVVPVAYSRKFAGLFEGVLGYPHLLPVKGYDDDGALAYLLDAVDRRAALAAEVAAGNRVVTARLEAYGQELERLFGRIAAARA